MLRGIPSILSPELLKILMEMGHGDEIVLGDGNFPAASCAARLVRCDGHGVPEVLAAILRLMPLDYAAETTAALMAVGPGNAEAPPVWDTYRSIIGKYDEAGRDFELIERFAFYERAKRAYAIVATGERARFANIILKKGIVVDE